MRLEGSYEQIDKRLSTLEARLENGFNDLRAEIRLTDTKIAKLEQKFDTRFDKLDQKIDNFAQQTDAKFDKLTQQTDDKFDKLDRKIDARFSLIVFLGGVIVVLQVLGALEII